MSAKTKIIVLRKRDLALAGILVLLAAGLILFLVTLLGGKDAVDTSTDTAKYTPGVYTSTVTLNDTAMDVEVVVDENNINSISLVHLDESVETMYPLIKPAMEDISQQILNSQSADGVTYSESNQYTSMVLHNAIRAALEKSQTLDQ